MKGKGASGVPYVVNQEELKTRRGQAKVWGTVKEAVIEGEPDCPNIVVSSVCNTKPVLFISTSTEKTALLIEQNKYFISLNNALPL